MIIVRAWAGSDGRRLDHVDGRARAAHGQREVQVTPIFAALTGRMLREKPESSGSSQFVAAESLGQRQCCSRYRTWARLRVKTRAKERLDFQVLAGSSKTETMLAFVESGRDEERRSAVLAAVCATGLLRGARRLFVTVIEPCSRKKSSRTCLQAVAKWLEDDAGRQRGIKYGVRPEWLLRWVFLACRSCSLLGEQQLEMQSLQKTACWS